NHPIGATIPRVGNESARLDPSNLAVAADDPVFEAIFRSALMESPPPDCFDLISIIWVHSGLPLATFYFSCPLRNSMNGRITLRNWYLLRATVVPEAADESGLGRQLQLHGALG